MKNKILQKTTQNPPMILGEGKLSIKYWAEEDRPREKLLQKGKNQLSDAELLAILLNTGTSKVSALDIAKNILSEVKGNLNQLSKLSIAHLKQFKGIGEAKAITISAALELGNRKINTSNDAKICIKTSSDAYDAIRPMLQDLPHEEFWILHLNQSLNLIKKERISIGGLAATIVDIRLISKSCLENLTSNLILCHNHPSEKKLASDADIKITQEVKNALSIFDIYVKDHIIVCGKDYFSFADQGML